MMRAIARDTWRAVLVVVGGSLLLEVHALVQHSRPATPPPPPPAVTTPTVTTYGGHPPAWQPQPQPQIIVQPQPPERPLRRVAQAVMELGDSMIGVVR